MCVERVFGIGGGEVARLTPVGPPQLYSVRGQGSPV